ncbi:MAG: hypothetical protein V3S14_08255 [Anaerolineae bacterium]
MMQITTPTEIQSVAWEGDLAAPAVSFAAKSATRLTATIGRPEIWPAAEALENEVGQKWTPFNTSTTSYTFAILRAPALRTLDA